MVLLVLLQGSKKECPFQFVHQLFQALAYTFVSDIMQGHHYCGSIHANKFKYMCQVQSQCRGIFEPTCQNQPDKDGSSSRMFFFSVVHFFYPMRNIDVSQTL